MWGEINIKLREVIAFNRSDSIWNLFKSEDPDATDIVVIDASDSMNKYQSTMKLMAGCLKCVSKTQGKWDLPAAEGLTALVDAVNVAHKRLVDAGLAGDGNGRIIVISDGMDNDSKARELLSENDTRIPMPSSSQRVQAVADHINFLGCEMIVVGIGTEVKELVAACNKPGRVIKTALVDRNATAADVGAVMREVVRRSRNPALRGSRGRLAPSAAPNADGTIGTVTAQSAPRVSDEDAEPIAREGAKTADSNAAKAKRAPKPLPPSQPKPTKPLTAAEKKQMLKDEKEAALAKFVPKIHPVRQGEKFDQAAQAAYVCLLISHVCENNLTLQGWVGGALTWFDGFIRAAANQFASPALLTTRQYPSDTGDFHGPVFASPLPKVLKDGKEMTDPKWQTALKDLFLALTYEPTSDYLRDKYPELPGQLASLPNGEYGPLYIDLGKMGWHVELSAANNLPQLDGRAKNLFYKFKPKDHMHVVRNPRASETTFSSGRPVTDFTVAANGNSGGTRVSPASGLRAFEERADSPIPPMDKWFLALSPAAGASTSTAIVAPVEDSDLEDADEEPPPPPGSAAAAFAASGPLPEYDIQAQDSSLEEEEEEQEEEEQEEEEEEQEEQEEEEQQEEEEEEKAKKQEKVLDEWSPMHERFKDTQGRFDGCKYWKAKYEQCRDTRDELEAIVNRQTNTMKESADKLKDMNKTYNAASKNVDELRKSNEALKKKVKETHEAASSEAITGYKSTIADLVVSERAAKRKREEAEQKLGGVQTALNNANAEVETWKAKYKKAKSALDAAIA